MTKVIRNIDGLFVEIKSLIEEAKLKIAVSFNSTTTVLNWNIGSRINLVISNEKRAIYGKEVIKTLSKQLTEELGRGME